MSESIALKIYSITDAGQAELMDWLTQPCEPTAIREDLGVMGLAGHLVPHQVVMCELERRRQLHANETRAYRVLG